MFHKLKFRFPQAHMEYEEKLFLLLTKCGKQIGSTFQISRPYFLRSPYVSLIPLMFPWLFALLPSLFIFFFLSQNWSQFSSCRARDKTELLINLNTIFSFFFLVGFPAVHLGFLSSLERKRCWKKKIKYGSGSAPCAEIHGVNLGLTDGI